ncbi:MAG: mechanosensitive ion channel [Caldilineaceae bacterium]|nr:mechanosensitive ion channel [Caldilineaceae bacterium]
MIETIISEPFFLWAVAIVIITPLAIIALGELIATLERRQSPYVAFWRYLRHGTFPLAVALLILQYVLNVPTDSGTLLLLQTVFWIMVTVTLLVLVQAIATAGSKGERWEASIPGLFTAVARALIFFVPFYYILSGIWGVDLSNLVTALGIGSLVIALALQDTLSNLVSGLLLLADKPFAVGDWIEIEGHTGKVLDLNWRSVRLQVRGRDVLVIPNSVLSNSSIYNYTMITPTYREHIAVGFSYNDPPNKVKRMLLDAVAGSDQILASPPPSVLTVSYDDSSIGYELVVYVKEYRSPFSRMQLRDEILTRIYYGAQRTGINIPFPIRTLYHFDGERPDPKGKQQEIAGYLQPNFYFATLDTVVLEHVAGVATVQAYGRHEIVVTAGRPAAALFVIVRGRAELSALDAEGDAQTVDRLGTGDIFGESVLLGNRPSTMTLTALEDLTVVRIPSAVINEVVERNPRFALALDELVEERLRIVRALREKEPSVTPAAMADTMSAQDNLSANGRVP